MAGSVSIDALLAGVSAEVDKFEGIKPNETYKMYDQSNRTFLEAGQAKQQATQMAGEAEVAAILGMNQVQRVQSENQSINAQFVVDVNRALQDKNAPIIEARNKNVQQINELAAQLDTIDAEYEKNPGFFSTIKRDFKRSATVARIQQQAYDTSVYEQVIARNNQAADETLRNYRDTIGITQAAVSQEMALKLAEGLQAKKAAAGIVATSASSAEDTTKNLLTVTTTRKNQAQEDARMALNKKQLDAENKALSADNIQYATWVALGGLPPPAGGYSESQLRTGRDWLASSGPEVQRTVSSRSLRWRQASKAGKSFTLQEELLELAKTTTAPEFAAIAQHAGQTDLSGVARMGVDEAFMEERNRILRAELHSTKARTGANIDPDKIDVSKAIQTGLLTKDQVTKANQLASKSMNNVSTDDILAKQMRAVEAGIEKGTPLLSSAGLDGEEAAQNLKVLGLADNAIAFLQSPQGKMILDKQVIDRPNATAEKTYDLVDALVKEGMSEQEAANSAATLLRVKAEAFIRDHDSATLDALQAVGQKFNPRIMGSPRIPIVGSGRLLDQVSGAGLSAIKKFNEGQDINLADPADVYNSYIRRKRLLSMKRSPNDPGPSGFYY